VEKTSLQISVCTLIRSKEATLMEPPARTDWRDVEQLPVEVEALLGAQEVAGEDELHQQLLADASGVELLAGMAISELDGRTTSDGMRARRAAMASASA
jgi:hypothetical protein